MILNDHIKYNLLALKHHYELKYHHDAESGWDWHYGSVLWRDVSRNGIFWCPFVVLGIGYWVFGIRVYTYIHITYIHIHIYILYIYISIEYWVWVYIQYAWLSMDDGGRLWYDITWSVIMKKHMAQTKTQYQYAWLCSVKVAQI